MPNAGEAEGLRRRAGHGDADAQADANADANADADADAQLDGDGLRSLPPPRERHDSNASSTAATASDGEPEAPSPPPRRRKGVMDLLFSPLSMILGEPEPEDPQVAARLFSQSLRKKYGTHCPRFELTSFRDAVSTARTMSKFLLVFLHSSIHDDADAFCRSAICTPQFTEYVNDSDSLVAWAGCVQQVEGFSVSLSLGCAKFPFVALIACTGRALNIVEKITVKIPASQLIRVLNIAMARNNQILTNARHVQQQRTEEQILRQQQDREYQESLEADRRREEEARLAEQREAEEKEKEAEEARRREEALKWAEEQYKKIIAAKRERLLDIPPSRVPPPGADYTTAMIRFHLYDGTRLERLFYAHDTLEKVRDYIDVEFYDRKIPIKNFELATNFPKKTFGPELLDMTLEEAGLAPQSLVYVQDLDS